MLFSKKSKIALCLGVFFILNNTTALAETSPRQYSYDDIKTTITVNKDSSFQVEEQQTFRYVGTFHQGWREIPLRGLGSITDIKVIDGKTNQPLIYSRRELDKTDPASWGKFTYRYSEDNEIIEWYYDLTDTTHQWIIFYTVRAGLEFRKDFDRLYWNIFTDYDAPVAKALAKVILPKEIDSKKIEIAAYRSSSKPIKQGSSEDAVYFEAENFAPHEAFTIDLGWPRGAVDRLAYWRWLLKERYGYIFGGIILILAILAGGWRWFSTERYKKGRGVIIAEYEPPKEISPAMAQVIMTEDSTQKGLTSTIIDLAVRGFIKIEEDFKKPFFFISRHYTIKKQKPLENDPNLRLYEQQYLQLLFDSTDEFSTRQLKKDLGRQRAMKQAVPKIKDEIFKEVEKNTPAFTVGLMAEKKKQKIWTVAFIILGAAIYFGAPLPQIIILLITVGVSAAGLWAFVKFEARLSPEGQLLREKLLGFKLYLETAERYRLENLPPDRFEKFLPYALVFGVEKKWAKAFETLHLTPPSWYGTAAIYSSGFSSGGSFSPMAFSTSFSSSFTSAFSSSSGGSGAGGGGAGGGGGGGGGGAS